MKDIPQYPKLLILMILLAGIVLRFWNFWEIPFMFDELSAMSRTGFDNFADLIKIGVAENDFHPAGVQVFMYYWIRLFGDAEFVVKLPFMLAGVAAIWLSFKIGDLWFGQSTGILTAAYVSSIQLFVLYGQIARPYVSGLFFSLLMVFYWSKYFLVRQKLKYLALFVLFAALTAYNHYFSLLFVATVGISGLFLANRKTIIPYTLSGLAIFVLYIPHLGIFFSQASKGSIGWLGEPGPYFLFDFLRWLFHYSYWSYVLILLIVTVGSFTVPNIAGSSIQKKKRLVLLLWLVPAPVFGYIYSYTAGPILQYSLLIFSAPYLFVLIFSFIGNISLQRISIVVALIILVNSLTLIFIRDHYRHFYRQPFSEVVKKAIQLEEKYPDDVFIINDYLPYYSEYYFSKHEKAIPYYTVRNKNLTTLQFDSVVQAINENVVITSGLDPVSFMTINQFFPYWIDYNYGFTFEHFTFAKTLPEGEKELSGKTVAVTDFSSEIGNWKINDKYIEEDSVRNTNVFHMNPGTKYGPGITMPLSEITDSRYLFIDIAVQVKALEKNSQGAIVAVIKNGEETIQWKSVNFSEFELKEGEWSNVYLTIDLLVSLGRKGNVSPCSFDTYIWNPNNNNFLIRSYEITSRQGNPYRYSLYYEIED